MLDQHRQHNRLLLGPRKVKKVLSVLLAVALGCSSAFGQAVQSTQPAAGQYPGTTTNDSAAAGKVGEYVHAFTQTGGLTATITIASPGVITISGHTINGVTSIVFTTDGALPTGITSGTNYFTLASTTPGAPFSVATTADNAIAGTAINTSGTQSGTHTANSGFSSVSGTSYNLAAISLTAGDWDVSLTSLMNAANTTTVAGLTHLSISTTSATLDSTTGRVARQQPYTADGNTTSMWAGPYRVSIAATTTYYAVIRPSFATSTMAVNNGTLLRARRVR